MKKEFESKADMRFLKEYKGMRTNEFLQSKLENLNPVKVQQKKRIFEAMQKIEEKKQRQEEIQYQKFLAENERAVDEFIKAKSDELLTHSYYQEKLSLMSEEEQKESIENYYKSTKRKLLFTLRHPDNFHRNLKKTDKNYDLLIKEKSVEKQFFKKFRPLYSPKIIENCDRKDLLEIAKNMSEMKKDE